MTHSYKYNILKNLDKYHTPIKCSSMGVTHELGVFMHVLSSMSNDVTNSVCDGHSKFGVSKSFN
jgi:hypothetical protein